MNDFAIEKLNSFGNVKVGNDVIEWLDNNNEVVINNSLYNVLQDIFSKDDYTTLCEAFEHLFDFYNADTIENLIDTWDMEKQIMIEDEDWDELKELTTDIEYSLRDNGEGSYFRSGDYFTDDALSIWNFVRWLANEED